MSLIRRCVCKTAATWLSESRGVSGGGACAVGCATSRGGKHQRTCTFCYYFGVCHISVSFCLDCVSSDFARCVKDDICIVFSAFFWDNLNTQFYISGHVKEFAKFHSCEVPLIIIFSTFKLYLVV